VIPTACAPQGPKEKRAIVFPLAFWIIVGLAVAIACILMPLAMRPEPPRRSIARPMHWSPSTSSSSRPVAPASPPAAVPLALGEPCTGIDRAASAIDPATPRSPWLKTSS